jgi:hypothetical protein
MQARNKSVRVVLLLKINDLGFKTVFESGFGKTKRQLQKLFPLSNNWQGTAMGKNLLFVKA